MSRIILHIGTHKTATTSIQKFLASNRDELKKRGIFYPDYSLVKRAPHYAHLGMVNALSGRHPKYSQPMAERFFKRVVERSKDYDTTIISGEPFYRHIDVDPSDNKKHPAETYWPLREAYIKKIRRIFGDVEVVVVFRRQTEYAQSLYQEHIKATTYSRNFQRFLDDFWFHFAFNDQALRWKAEFPKFKAFSFEGLAKKKDIVHEFCSQLGLDLDDLALPERSNEGLPVDLVILKRMIHRGSVINSELRPMLQELVNKFPETLWQDSKNRSFFGSNAAQIDFQKKFDDDNERLKTLISGPFAEEEKLFPESSKEMIYGDHMNERFLMAVVQKLLDA